MRKQTILGISTKELSLNTLTTLTLVAVWDFRNQPPKSSGDKNLATAVITIVTRRILNYQINRVITQTSFQKKIFYLMQNYLKIEKKNMIAREKKYLQCLDKAILMINDGTFGICISCNKKINKCLKR